MDIRVSEKLLLVVVFCYKVLVMGNEQVNQNITWQHSNMHLDQLNEIFLNKLTELDKTQFISH